MVKRKINTQISMVKLVETNQPQHRLIEFEPVKIKISQGRMLTLGEPVLEEMFAALSQSRATGKEVAFHLCQTNQGSAVSPGMICDGNECSVQLQGCAGDGRKVAGFHTHPKQSGESKQTRRLYQNVPSIADVMVMLGDYMDSGAEFHCIGNTEWDRVTCWRLKNLVDFSNKAPEKLGSDREFQEQTGEQRVKWNNEAIYQAHSTVLNPLQKLRYLKKTAPNNPAVRVDGGQDPDLVRALVDLNHKNLKAYRAMGIADYPAADTIEEALVIPVARLKQTAPNAAPCYVGVSPGRVSTVRRLAKQYAESTCGAVKPPWKENLLKPLNQSNLTKPGCANLHEEVELLSGELDQIVQAKCAPVKRRKR